MNHIYKTPFSKGDCLSNDPDTGEVPVTLSHSDTIARGDFFEKRDSYRYDIADFIVEYCNPHYNLAACHMYIGCN